MGAGSLRLKSGLHSGQSRKIILCGDQTRGVKAEPRRRVQEQGGYRCWGQQGPERQSQVSRSYRAKWSGSTHYAGGWPTLSPAQWICPSDPIAGALWLKEEPTLA